MQTPPSRRQRIQHLCWRYRRLATVVVFLSTLLALFQFSGLRSQFNLAFLQHQLLAHQGSGLLLFVLLFSLGNLIQIPGWLFLAAAVLTLGQFWGGIVTYIAASLSCLLTFLVIRAIGGDALRAITHPVATRILAQLDQHPLRSVLWLRVLFQTVPALNYALALSGIRFWKYALGTLLGLPLPIAAYCLFFDTLAKILHIV
jgi:uncharacterized membrane protein YdjX (TVP38/TMEM64 family)